MDNLILLNKINNDKLNKIVSIIESVSMLENAIHNKIIDHKKNIEQLQNNYKQSVESYHIVCKNLLDI